MSVFTNPSDGAGDAATAYVRATLGLLGDRAPVSVLRSTPAELAAIVEAHSVEALTTPERAGKWSATQVMQHLADSDLVWAYRMRMVLAHDQPILSGYDQDAWAERLNYAAVVPTDALRQFAFLRELNLGLIGGLSNANLQRTSLHSERGEERLDHMIDLYAGHDLVHLRQLNRILAAVS